MGSQTKYHFVLVHGAYHGAWCWYKLIDRLQNGGHQVTALDMAGAGQHPADPNTITTFEQYNQPVTDFFEALPKEDPSKVVVIAHSMGGLSCMELMERFAHKIGLLIYVAAVITPSGVSVMDCSQLNELVYTDTAISKAVQYVFANGADQPPTSLVIPKPQLREIFYTGWESEDVVLATILVRPVPSQMLAIPIMCAEEKYKQVPKVYIKYLQDNTVVVAAQNWIIENTIGPFNEIVEVEGGHFHFHVKIDEFTQLVYRLTKNYFCQG